MYSDIVQNHYQYFPPNKNVKRYSTKPLPILSTKQKSIVISYIIISNTFHQTKTFSDIVQNHYQYFPPNKNVQRSSTKSLLILSTKQKSIVISYIIISNTFHQTKRYSDIVQNHDQYLALNKNV